MIAEYEAYLKNSPEISTRLFASTRGKAKKKYWRDMIDCCPDLRFIDVRVRKVSELRQGETARTDEQFKRTARYRGLPELGIGTRVRTEGGIGTIVSNNDSANFQVIFDDDSPKFAGLELNCHPYYFEVIE